MVLMDELTEHDQDAGSNPQPRGRGGLESAIRGALSRPVPGAPAHWGGARPPRAPVEPVDVAAGPPPGRLPPT